MKCKPQEASSQKSKYYLCDFAQNITIFALTSNVSDFGHSLHVFLNKYCPCAFSQSFVFVYMYIMSDIVFVLFVCPNSLHFHYCQDYCLLTHIQG